MKIGQQPVTSPYMALLRTKDTQGRHGIDDKTASIRSYPKRLSPTVFSDDFYTNITAGTLTPAPFLFSSRAVVGKKYWGAGPSSFGRQQRLSEITVEPITSTSSRTTVSNCPVLILAGELGKISGRGRSPPWPNIEPPLFSSIFDSCLFKSGVVTADYKL